MDKNSVVIPSEMQAMYDNFHFAPAVKDGDRLFCSGVIGIGSDGKASSDPETQFTQAFESLKSVLTAAGASFGDVVDITTFHVGLQQNIRDVHQGEGSLRQRAVSGVDRDRHHRTRISRRFGGDQSRRAPKEVTDPDMATLEELAARLRKLETATSSRSNSSRRNTAGTATTTTTPRVSHRCSPTMAYGTAARSARARAARASSSSFAGRRRHFHSRFIT